MSASLQLLNVNAHYGNTQVLEDLSLHVKEGELVALLGASGCGKTTTLRLVAGFLEPTSGSIQLGEQNLGSLPAHARNIGLVFQTYALFPHLNVRDNVAFGLRQRGIRRSQRHAAANDMIERVGLAGYELRHPADLSGGQRQRVALARALVIDPPLLMFDEPLSNLDAKLRVDMRVEIRRLQRASGATALYVTHDQEEAFSISDRVAIMHAGRIMQLDVPEILYSHPANAFVADFVGFENRIPMQLGNLGVGGDTHNIDADGGPIRWFNALLSDGTSIKLPFDSKDIPGRDFVFAARADGLHVSLSGEGIPARLGLRTFLGRAYQYCCDTAHGELIANGDLAEPLEPGTHVVLQPVASHCCLLPSQS